MKSALTVVFLLQITLGCSTFSAKESTFTERKPSNEASIVESCSPNEDSEIYPPYALLVEIMENQTGHFARLSNQKTHVAISPDVLVVVKGSRQKNGWIYETSPQTVQESELKFKLEMYRTNQSERTPTTVNAHLNFQNDEKNMSFRAHRLECKKINLAD